MDSSSISGIEHFFISDSFISDVSDESRSDALSARWMSLKLSTLLLDSSSMSGIREDEVKSDGFSFNASDESRSDALSGGLHSATDLAPAEGDEGKEDEDRKAKTLNSQLSTQIMDSSSISGIEHFFISDSFISDAP